MANVFYEKDSDLSCLKDKKILVLGYGSQGHAQALNLRDSGVNVAVCVREDGPSYKVAQSDGWVRDKDLFTDIKSCIRAFNWIHILVPDEVQKSIWDHCIKHDLTKGSVLSFSHGFNICYGQIVPRDDIDVILIAPKGPGHLVRRTYQQGIGTPALIAIEQDVSGRSKDMGLAFCKGIGSLRAGVIETTFREETETDNFGEQVVLCGGVVELIKAGFETLVEAGYQPEVAYFECLHELKLITDMIQEGGISNMNNSISNMAEYGEYSRGNRIITDRTRKSMKKILSEIKSGEFAREYLLESQAGSPVMYASRRNMKDHLIEKVGTTLRSMMLFLHSSKQVTDVNQNKKLH